MSILLINLANEKRDYIIKKCIANRVDIYSADRTNDVQKILSVKDISYIIMDLNSPVIDWFSYLKQLRGSEGGDKYKVIICSNRQDRDFIKELLLLGIIGFVAGNLDAARCFEKINSLIKITVNIDKERKHFRVVVPSEENLGINFKISSHDDFIKGKVTDLSIVAVAFKLDNPQSHISYREGDVIEKVQLKIENKLILFTMKIIKPGPLTVGRILDMTEGSMHLLSLYIYKAMIGLIDKSGNGIASLATA